MPKLKEPTSLEKIAFEVLFECAVRCCDRISAPKGFNNSCYFWGAYIPGSMIAEGSLDELTQAISVIEESICNRLPWHLEADFCTRFLERFYHESRPKTHYEVAMAMIRNRKVVGLRLKGGIQRYRDRILSLGIVDVDYNPGLHHRMDIELENFHLCNLTTFIHPRYCTDHNLDIIGQSCPRLKVLNVSCSIDVTDEGLRVLSPCSKLRVVDVVECLKVSHISLTHLLSVHKELTDFSYGHDPCSERQISDTEVDVLSGLDWSVQCPSISRFVFENNRVARLTVDLQAIVAKFPNLSYLKINCTSMLVLTPLESLSKLSGLEVNFGQEMPRDLIERMWASVRALLRRIGSNIITLKLACWVSGAYSWDQNAVDFIFESCPNLESFKFDLAFGDLVMPPFPKLKELRPCIPFREYDVDPVTHFGQMFHCEEYGFEALSLLEFPVNYELIESIMLDNMKFPNLSVVETGDMGLLKLLGIKLIARQNNLDFKLQISKYGEGCRVSSPLPRSASDDEMVWVTDDEYDEFDEDVIDAYFPLE